LVCFSVAACMSLFYSFRSQNVASNRRISFFIEPAEALLLSCCCVAHLYRAPASAKKKSRL
jgi:hypothetical protein